MKKLLFLLFILLSFNAFAQETNNGNKKVSPWSLGISGFGYIPTVDNDFIDDNIGYGGGFGLKFKANVNRFLGFATEFNYTYANKTYSSDGIDILTINSNMIDIREALVIQYEKYKGENGFVPWFSVGVGATFYLPEYKVLGLSNPLGDYSGVGFNVNIGAGLKYNYNHFYAGIFADWTYSVAYMDKYVGYSEISQNYINLDGVRIGAELGFRY